MPATIAAQPKPPVRPIAPMPLWERHELFQEPDCPPDFEPLTDDDHDQQQAGFTAVKPNR